MQTLPSESTRRRISRTLFTSQGLYTGAIIIAFTLTPVIAVDLTGQESAAGLPSTANLIGRAAMAYPAGWLMDKIGRRYGLSLGYFVGVFGAAVSVWGILSESFALFLLGALLLGMTRGAAEQGRFAAAEIYPTSRRSQVIGAIVFAGTFGSILGPLMVAPAGRWALTVGLPEFAGPFFVAGLLLLLALIFTFLLLRPDPLILGRQVAAVEARDSSAPALAPARQLRAISRDGAVRLAVLAMVTGQLVMTLLMVITPVYMNRLSFGTQEISWVIMAHTLGMFGLSGVSGRLVVRFGRRAIIAAGTLVLAASCLLAAFATTVPTLALALFLLGLGWNFCYVAGSTLLTDNIQANERGKAQGANEVVVALASGAGSLATGAIFFLGGMIAVAAFGLALTLILAAVLVASANRGRDAISSSSSP